MALADAAATAASGAHFGHYGRRSLPPVRRVIAESLGRRTLREQRDAALQRASNPATTDAAYERPLLPGLTGGKELAVLGAELAIGAAAPFIGPFRRPISKFVSRGLGKIAGKLPVKGLARAAARSSKWAASDTGAKLLAGSAAFSAVQSVDEFLRSRTEGRGVGEAAARAAAAGSLEVAIAPIGGGLAAAAAKGGARGARMLGMRVPRAAEKLATRAGFWAGAGAAGSAGYGGSSAGSTRLRTPSSAACSAAAWALAGTSTAWPATGFSPRPG